MRRALLFLSLAAALASAAPAEAAEWVTDDGAGRMLRFDIRSETVDPEWYAALLRAAPHGDEISTLRVDVVAREELLAVCGRGADGCYSEDVITVPDDQTESTAHTVVHEYGHHLDASRPVTGVREPNGTPVWWRARGMNRLVRLGSVARSYVIGWNRSIGEIFAEDYAQLARPGGPYAIPWLDAPDETILQALRADLGLGPAPEVFNPPALKPVSIDRAGTLGSGRSATIDFTLLGPGRRVEATARIAGRATLEIRCDGRRVALSALAAGRRTVTLDRRDLGPAQCTATVRNRGTVARAFRLVVRLSVDA